MPKKRWSDLSERTRRLIVRGAVLEAVLKILALVDLRRRPVREVNGSKKAWAAAVTVVNSLGAVPVAYFLFGRRVDRSR